VKNGQNFIGLKEPREVQTADIFLKAMGGVAIAERRVLETCAAIA